MKVALSGIIGGLLTMLSGLLHVLDVIAAGRAGAKAAESERLGVRAREREKRARADREEPSK
jgi:hypothetical protein